MAINQKTVCNSCGAEFEIVESDDYPILYCAACGTELEQEDEVIEDRDDEV